ncbi:MAG: flagellar basal body-associated protein FliL [Hyphomicrobium sp.]|uniref:flagellar basal body-associated FliL family protein n=1 Tax=Hyphomicrobium sp. TaxID=82 RepID=UPI003D0BE093
MAGGGASGESKGGGLIGLVVVTVLAIGLGAGFGFFLSGLEKGAAEADGAKDENAKTKEAKSRDAAAKESIPSTAKLVALTPIVVNLAQPADTWIRIEASMLVDGMAEGGEADALAAQLAEDYAAYLRTATLAQFEGASGFQNLREDFLDRAIVRDREHIKDVIIHGVVVE